MYNTDNSTNWLNKILDIHELSDISINQTFSSKTWLGLTVEQRAKDQFIQEWQNDVLGSNKGTMYLNMKSSFESEKYLIILPANLNYLLQVQNGYSLFANRSWQVGKTENRLPKKIV